jgi:hypothetical protein
MRMQAVTLYDLEDTDIDDTDIDSLGLDMTYLLLGCVIAWTLAVHTMP